MPAYSYTTTDESIRKVLVEELENTHGTASTHKTAIISELPILRGSARIDVAVINGIMHGYELKSDKDTLQRLSLQISAYNMIFDKLTLVVGKRHVIKAIDKVPRWWGITTAKTMDNNLLHLINIREAKSNPKQDTYSMLQMLWKDELLDIVEKTQTNWIMQNKSKEFLTNRLVEANDHRSLKDYVRQYLTRRYFNST